MADMSGGRVRWRRGRFVGRRGARAAEVYNGRGATMWRQVGDGGGGSDRKRCERQVGKNKGKSEKTRPTRQTYTRAAHRTRFEGGPASVDIWRRKDLRVWRHWPCAALQKSLKIDENHQKSPKIIARASPPSCPSAFQTPQASFDDCAAKLKEIRNGRVAQDIFVRPHCYQIAYRVTDTALRNCRPHADFSVVIFH